MYNNFQRKGAVSNAHVGREFEEIAKLILEEQGINVKSNFHVKIRIGKNKKAHQFDLGSNDPPVIVECKSHRWTSGANVPSAKMTVWNEAMYFFVCAPKIYRKILFVLRDLRKTTNETLAEYYIRTYRHLIPDGVEIWEFDESTSKVNVIYRA